MKDIEVEVMSSWITLGQVKEVMHKDKKGVRTVIRIHEGGVSRTQFKLTNPPLIPFSHTEWRFTKKGKLK